MASGAIHAKGSSGGGAFLLDESGNLVGTIISRKGTAAEINALTLSEGELGVTTDTDELRMGDGVTAGGLRVGNAQVRHKVVPNGATIQSVIDAITDNDSTHIYVIHLDAKTYTENVTLKDYVHLRGPIPVTNTTVANAKITSATTGTVKITSNTVVENIFIENTASGGFGLCPSAANISRVIIKGCFFSAPTAISAKQSDTTLRTFSIVYIDSCIFQGTDDTVPLITWSGSTTASAINYIKNCTTISTLGTSSLSQSVIQLLGNTRIQWMQCVMGCTSSASAVAAIDTTSSFSDNSSYYDCSFVASSSHASGTVDGYKMGSNATATATVFGGRFAATATSGATAVDINTASSGGAKINVNGVRFRTTSGTSIDGIEVTAYAAGTVYSLTNTAAKIDFGTTDPEVVLPIGLWRLNARVVWKKNAATHVANRTITIKLRDTTASADVANSSTAVSTGIDTTITQTMTPITLPVVVFSAAAATTIQLWGSIDTVASAGSDDIVEADIFAERIR